MLLGWTETKFFWMWIGPWIGRKSMAGDWAYGTVRTISFWIQYDLESDWTMDLVLGIG